MQCSNNKRLQKAAERDIELLNFTPDSKIGEIKKFTVNDQIKNAEAFQFYVNGLPLPTSLLKLAKDDAVLLVYVPGSNPEQMTSTQLLFHFNMPYLPSLPK